MSANNWFTLEGSGSVLFPFLTLEGSLQPAREKIERVEYPGVDGIALWFVGEKGEPFNVDTQCDYASLANARSAFAGYVAKIGTKLDLYYRAGFWGTVVVHNVTLKNMKAMQTVVGGVNVASGNAGTMLSVSWQIETVV